MADVAAPPYDVIGPAEQKELYERHPCNVIRLILNRDEPGDESSEERYIRAAEFLRHWQSEGILFQEREETFYVYHQEFQWEGVEYVRKGFLGRLRLEEFGKGNVFPHEQTMAGPKADRLKLTQACQMNLSPIFALYPDDDANVQTPLEEAIAGQTALEVTDDLGVLHRIWRMTNPAVLNQIRERMAEKSIYIADGHHRYETAVNYRNFLQSEGKLKNEAAAANFVLMMFVGMNDPGLAILPTHRLISGLPDLTADDIRKMLSPHFQLDDVGTGVEAAKDTWEMMEADGRQNVFGFGTAADGKWLFARLTDESIMAELAAEQSEDWRQLGVSLLHKLVLDHLVKRNNPESEQVCKYVHLLEEVTAGLSERSCQLACLVAPAQIEDVEVIASKFEKMPPKSTFFYPKLLSGLVFNPLA